MRNILNSLHTQEVISNSVQVVVIISKKSAGSTLKLM